VEGLRPGTTLGGRYTVITGVEARRGTERWSAEDSTLARGVTVLCLPARDHRRDAVLDAARRAAAVDSPGLVRVLDVGREGSVVYVVEEDTSTATTLTELVAAGGLPGDEVRRIAGEVASALDQAGQRGLHHLDLTPGDVVRTPEGDVRLRGVATAAACADLDDLPSPRAARADAVGVVALTYAGLTGLWPLARDGAGLGSALAADGAVPAPSDVAAGVPRDLDALCRLTLQHDAGPTSPGDFARQVAPWPTRQVVGPPRVVAAPPSAGPAEPAAAPTAALPVTSPPAAAVGSPTEAESAPTAEEARQAAAPTLAIPAAAMAAGVPSGPAGPQPAYVGGPPAPGSVDAFGGDHGDMEPPVPGVDPEPLTREQSKIALAIVAAFLAVALALGVWGVSRIGSQTDLGLDGPASGQAAPASPAPGRSPTASATDRLSPLAIIGADGFDPFGDQRENNARAPRVFDGDPGTAWTSERYSSATFGGLKDGTGVVVDLGPNVKPKEVRLQIPVTADVSVYIGPEKDLGSATKIGSKADASGTVVFPVPEGVTGQYVIVWFTKMERGADGRYRAYLGEITVLG
jgi:hypothetical protein